MSSRKPAQCETPGCTNKPVKQSSYDHLFERQWCCQDCLDDPLGLKKNHKRTEIDDLTDELKVKRNEFLKIRRQLEEQITQAQRVVNEQSFKIRWAVFNLLSTFETPRPLLEYWANKYNTDKYREPTTPEEIEQGYREARMRVPTVEDLVFSGWPCPVSPTGNCMYDDHHDNMHDGCIFCGEPEERK